MHTALERPHSQLAHTLFDPHRKPKSSISLRELNGFAQVHTAGPSKSSAEPEFEPGYFYSKFSAFLLPLFPAYASAFAYVTFPRKQTLTRHVAV